MNDDMPTFKWNPDTEDWVKNRKFVAVLNEGARCLVYRCGHFFYIGDTEGDDFVPEDEDRVISLVYLNRFTTDHAGNLILIFNKNGHEILFYEHDCKFYKWHRPPVIKQIFNKIEQNQI